MSDSMQSIMPFYLWFFSLTEEEDGSAAKESTCNAGREMGDAGLIPGEGTKIPHATWYGKKVF